MSGVTLGSYKAVAVLGVEPGLACPVLLVIQVPFSFVFCLLGLCLSRLSESSFPSQTQSSSSCLRWRLKLVFSLLFCPLLSPPSGPFLRRQRSPRGSFLFLFTVNGACLSLESLLTWTVFPLLTAPAASVPVSRSFPRYPVAIISVPAAPLRRRIRHPLLLHTYTTSSCVSQP